MTPMKKRYRIVLCGILLCLFTVLSVSAVDISIEPTDRFFINDFSHVISQEDEDAIYAMGVQLYEKTGAQVVAVTIPSLDGADILEYGVALGRDWGVGDADTNTGVVLLLATEDRDVAISVGYGLEGAITDYTSGILLDNYAIPYFESDDFSLGMRETYDAIVNEVYIEFGMEADENYIPAKQLDGNASSDFLMIAFLLIAVFIILPALRGHFPLFFFFGGGHHRGGGFGGHSGGGFSGGFRGGGGSFGGGGASRRF